MPRDLPAEKVQIRVLHPEFPDGATRLLAEDAKTGVGMNIALGGGRALVGKVVDGDGRPLRRARVRLRQVNGLGAEVAAFSDATGTFLLRTRSGETPGVLLAEAEEMAPSTLLVPDIAGDERLPEIVVDRGRPMKIRVEDSEGNPVSGAAVGGVLLRGGFALEPGLRTDALGWVVWTNAPREEVRVEAWREGLERAAKANSGGATEVVLQLPRIREIRGWVSDATTGAALPYFRVWRGQENPAAGETEWETEPAALGRNGAFRMAQGPAKTALVFRFDAPGYGTSGEFTPAALEARREAIPLKPW